MGALDSAVKPADLEVLEGQIVECFARVVYSHKTHEKCADMLEFRFAWMKNSQLVLSAATSAGLLGVLFTQDWLFASASALASFALLLLNAYLRQYDLGKLAQEHRQAGVQLWRVREEYLSLLTDLRVGDVSVSGLRATRDALLEELSSIYAGAPSTWSAAYKKAQEALQEREELTFSEDEIDDLLPVPLRRDRPEK